MDHRPPGPSGPRALCAGLLAVLTAIILLLPGWSSAATDVAIGALPYVGLAVLVVGLMAYSERRSSAR